MYDPAFERLEALAKEPDALARTVAYVTVQLRSFLRRHERVLICFPNHGASSFGGIMEKAVRQAEGIPLLWGSDYRWKALLRQAFVSRATTIVGPPLMILGLTKIARATETPLYIRNVLTAGYPCMNWMADGITKGLDCRIRSCYTLGNSPIVAGFSCAHSLGIHLRDDVYSVQIVDEEGTRLPEGTVGEVVLIPKSDPSVRYPVIETARLESQDCGCGGGPRLMDFGPGRQMDPILFSIGERIQSWTSVLDCRLEKGPCGLEMEVIVFPGEKLPQLPSCAKQVVRAWDPDRDMPLRLATGWKNVTNSANSH